VGVAGGYGEVITPATVRLEVTGAPGDLIGSLASSPLPAFDLLGLSLHTGTGSLDLGSAIDGNGKARVSFAIPRCTANLLPILAGLQVIALDRAGNLVATGPATVVVR
jgi:hypothetical protein